MFRSAKNSDSATIKALIFGVLKDYGLEPDPKETDLDLENIEKHYFESGRYFEVLENLEKEIVGTLGLYQKYGFTPYQAEHLSKRCDQAFIKHLDRKIKKY